MISMDAIISFSKVNKHLPYVLAVVIFFSFIHAITNNFSMVDLPLQNPPWYLPKYSSATVAHFKKL